MRTTLIRVEIQGIVETNKKHSEFVYLDQTFGIRMANSCMNTLVYVVDDDEDDRLLIREAMEGVMPHVTIIEAEDGMKLLSLLEPEVPLQARLPQLILLDMNMPRMDGMEVLKRIRVVPSLQGIPTVMISTSSQSEQMSEAYRLGVQGYLIKPSHFNEYEKIARSLVAKFLTPFV